MKQSRRFGAHSLFGGAIATSISSKLCPKCLLVKSVADFPVRSLLRSRPNAYCRECQREYSRAHYRLNVRKHNLRRLQNQRRYKVRNRRLMDEYLSGQACVDCGETDQVVLELDHVRGSKVSDVSTMIGRATSWKRIVEEIAKCEVRCANCHRRRTASQFWRHRKCGR
jgi:hypothetical protein